MRLTLKFGRMTSAQRRQVTYFADLGMYLLGVVCFPGVVFVSSVDCGNSEELKMLGDCCAIQSIIFFLTFCIGVYWCHWQRICLPMQETQETRVSILGWGRSLEEGNGNPLQYYCLGNPMDRRAWRAIVHGATKSRTRLSD